MIGRAAQRLRAERSGEGHDSEAGFTVIELMVVLSVMSLVAAGALAMLSGLLRNDRYQEALVNNQERVRFAMIEVTRDIRNANPLEPLDVAAEYANKLEMWIGPKAGPQTLVRWELVGTTLSRHELTPGTKAIISSRVVLNNVDNSAAGVDLFELYDESGNHIDSTLTLSPADYANCAIRVHVSIYAADDPVGAEFTETADAEIRNQLPGGIGCNY